LITSATWRMLGPDGKGREGMLVSLGFVDG
jgi:hypothetical protein